ncbi:hypothetical protein N7486_008725 [Penicillium sp. IBT 16267x]|nr:hypothetical protein N7486_008725 [Penicillium sp. IBT 16267x]
MHFTLLSPDCEALRKQIKAMIPATATRDDQINNTREAVISSEKEDGSKLYGGETVYFKLVHLAIKLGLDTDLVYEVVSWPDTYDVPFAAERGYVIPLNEVRATTGTFREGYMVKIDVNDGDNVKFVGQGTAILIVPRKNG